MPWTHPEGEMRERGMTPENARPVYELIWEYRRVCAANEIDRE